jgi:hypothetical protein
VVRILAHCVVRQTLSKLATSRIASLGVFYTFVQRATGTAWKELLRRGKRDARRSALAIFAAQIE